MGSEPSRDDTVHQWMADILVAAAFSSCGGLLHWPNPAGPQDLIPAFRLSKDSTRPLQAVPLSQTSGQGLGDAQQRSRPGRRGAEGEPAGIGKGTDDARPLILTRLQNALDDDVNILDRRIEGCRD